MNRVTAKKMVKLINQLKQLVDTDRTVLKITITGERHVEPVVELKHIQDVDHIHQKHLVVIRGEGRDGSRCSIATWMDSVEFQANETVLALREAGFDVPGEGNRANKLEYVVER